jgi:hypothetical protein
VRLAGGAKFIAYERAGPVVVGKLDADQPTLGGGRDVDEQPQQSLEVRALPRAST